MSAHRPESSSSGLAAHHAVFAATIGNLLETDDFAVYGFFALVLSRRFCPAGDETASLLLTVAAFGVCSAC
jgi:MHS family proline/betaine transporter-like MFS transporter